MPTTRCTFCPRPPGGLWSLLRTPLGRARLRDRIRAMLVGVVSRFGNYRSFRSGPRVTLEVICAHLDRIAQITGSHRHAAIGSDFDGFIKPTAAGLESAADLARLEGALRERYGHVKGESICSGHALRVLRAGWQR